MMTVMVGDDGVVVIMGVMIIMGVMMIMGGEDGGDGEVRVCGLPPTGEGTSCLRLTYSRGCVMCCFNTMR